eukprot:TRINITY_DN1216_c1_g1_i1.p1 TRINITY_DN1216_c1_g1~~TRINITY_DN1216_c1_g1_i1.p1  ORF type:complete len:313 (+),score=27.74 TRINITY_DN1216_c1_g1_i1:108-1046(+)
MNTANKVKDCEAILNSLDYCASIQPRIIEEFTGILGCNGSFRCEVGVRESGQHLRLKGIIETLFKQNTFYTPVEIWIPRIFPIAPPMFFVVPQEGMILAKGHVSMEHNGKCLIDWNPGYSLCFVLSSLVLKFNESPPLYAVKRTQWNTSSAGSSSSVTRLNDELTKKCISLQIMTSSTRDQVASQLRHLRLDISQKQHATTTLKQKTKRLLDRKDNLQSRIDSLEDWISANAHRAVISIDQMVPSTEIDCQVLELQAGINTDHDLMHLADRQLAKGSLDIRQYVKNITSLGASICMKQALLNKISRTRIAEM